MASKLQFFVNEKKVTLEPSDVTIDMSLASFLRNVLNLTGTKISCGVGGCGACTCLISRYSSEDKLFRHDTVNTCLTPLFSLNGAHILTVEGLSDSKSYHEIQESLALGNATQCGYCSPGFVMSIFGMETEEITDSINCLSKFKKGLEGNLCRCTGYRPILEAFFKDGDKCGNTCHKAKDGCCGDGDIEDAGTSCKADQQAKSPPNQAFTIEKLRNAKNKRNDCANIMKRIEDLLISQQSLNTENGSLFAFKSKTNSSWIIPKSRDELVKILNSSKNAKIVSGATSGEMWSSMDKSDVIVDVSKVREMRTVELTDTHLRLGASLTIEEVQRELKSVIAKLPDTKTKLLKALIKMTNFYGSGQVRRSATIGGSLVVSSNASDMQTANLGFGLTNNFMNGLDSVNMSILESVDIPINENITFAWYDKHSRRKNFDLALVNLAVLGVKCTNLEDEIDATFCFGGTLLSGRVTLSHKLATGDSLEVPTELQNAAVKLALQNISTEQSKNNPSSTKLVEASVRSMLKKLSIHLVQGSNQQSVAEKCNGKFKSTRILTKIDPDQQETDLVHRQVPHASAIKHVTGDAKYCDDIPRFKNELEMAFVLSTKAHAKIVVIDYVGALELDGVIGIVSCEDMLEGKNKFGLVEKDEEIFASETVTCFGQIILGILATDRDIAQKAAKLVKVEYEELEPVILSNEDAIKQNSFYSTYDLKLTKGDCSSIFANSKNIITGETEIGSQEHFYMEPQSCIVIPNGEDQELEIISSSQNPTGVQMQIANVLDIPAHRIVVKVKRVGGGFGGKESRCLIIALPTAVAAQKFGRPVRCVLPRDTDMLITGKRAPYLTKHKIAFNDDGKIEALQMQVYIGSGNSIDVTCAEIERVILNLDNAYNIPNLEFCGYICKTNLPSNTVFRGTGGPQAVFLMENIVDTVASYLGREPSLVRSLQIYKDEDFTPYGQSLKDSTVLKCWNECQQNSKYEEKKKQVEIFNRENSHVKRGISINPIQYGVGFTLLCLNQGAALVHIYLDGTVLISHAGVEIGQGVHTKMIQIATRVLGIPGTKIRIMETSTDKVPNTSPSSASMTSDLNGGAVMIACKELASRLEPYKLKNPNSTWEERITEAYTDRVSLSATGFYKVPEMGWNAAKLHGNPFSYFSSGAACTVVELDCLSGQFQIISTDIVMDVGKSLNPAIDVGQIEGAFMQGVGHFLLEELIYDDSGRLCNTSPLTYKIPTVNDTPLEFNVSFLMGPGNPKAIYSSKAIGEPPLLLATSVFFAVKDAIRAYRKENGMDVDFRLDSPASVDKILIACNEDK